jgi:hypothetical protein
VWPMRGRGERLPVLTSVDPAMGLDPSGFRVERAVAVLDRRPVPALPRRSLGRAVAAAWAGLAVAVRLSPDQQGTAVPDGRRRGMVEVPPPQPAPDLQLRARGPQGAPLADPRPEGRTGRSAGTGVGVLRLRPAGSTLLYVRGYARPPVAVLRLLPDKIRTVIRRLRLARLGKPAAAVQAAPGGVPTELAEGLERVVRATRFATATFCAAIVLTLVAVPLSGLVQTIFQYLATLGFVLAWAATYSGLYARSVTWLRGACLKAGKWWAITFVPVGLLNLWFTAVNKAPA